ncbi:long-chain fatty acid--CoA ligase [Xylella fastidiosa]|uniref:long-chain fatty acid--CoA ligase n=1 Tax=Xylella fastidiosa TaxID=2371 RepID=UPI0003D382BE|nr:long-chain fatty acid--CoA ligase [Xylella fastidiosa]KXB22193.1 long-chain fatty acid--CoA ligase [Xylella fastidiosa]OJZ72302.1 long-chain-fatty-acid--CoA ligase [Xylella fastidiosa 6c]
MSQTRPWLQHYPSGISTEIDTDALRTIADVFNTSVIKYRHCPAYTNFGKTLTYGEVDLLTKQFASYLLNVLKLKKGDRIALMMLNCLQYPVATFGALCAGLTVVNVNPLYTARELKHQLVDAGSTVLVVMDNFCTTVQQIIADTPIKQVITTELGDLLDFPKRSLINFAVKHIKKLVPEYQLPRSIRFREALALGSKHSMPPIHIASDDLAFLQYTGGTTGTPKGAMLTHRNMVANMQQVSQWLQTNNSLKEGCETVLTALPLYHIFALTANSLVFMKIGGCNHLISNPRNMRTFVKELQRVRFTVITGVNTLFNKLLNTPGFDKLDFSSLKIALGGGMVIQRSVAEQWKQVTHVPLIEAYGLTEASPAACINPLNLQEHNGSIGMPIPSTDVCIKDDTNTALPIGEMGELCIKGPQVMKGYWQRPEETSEVLDADGWLHTGDIVKMDKQGFLYIIDRKKEIILVSGFNVYPKEIEEVIAMIPGVAEVAAVGVPDEQSGEVVKVVIVKKDPMLTAEEVKAHAATNLTRYKLPRIIEFRATLPKTDVGKILRRELRDAAPASTTFTAQPK